MEVKESFLDEIEDLSFLTERQQQVVALRRKGLSYAKIGEQLGFCSNAARTHYANAERRAREYKRYNAIQERNKELADFPITRGELKLILDALSLLEIKLEGGHRFVGSDWKGRLPYEYDIVKDIQRRAHDYFFR